MILLFGIWVLNAEHFGGAAAKVSLATVYQRHSSLLTGNRMYRG